MPEPILRVVRVTKRFGSPQQGGETTVLKEANLEASRGDSLAIMGPSGSGKSTLLQIIGTLDRPTSGEVWIDGENVSLLSDDALAAVRNRRIGFVFQAHHLLPQCTVMENVLIPALAYSKSVSAETIQRAERLLARVGLRERLGQKAALLSGGERQRAAIVRALINKPDILLADEPTGALDQANSCALGDLLRELNREENLMLLIATHSHELARAMQRVLQLAGGMLTPAL
jgi:lipoprotein-releasing system ATP-binding protein